jgi:hypothetical protein
MTVARRIALLAVALVAVLGAVALWGLRPPLPRLPASLSAPVSTAFVQRSIVALAWAALLLLLAIVAVRAARAARRRPHTDRSIPLGRRPRRQPARNALRTARVPLPRLWQATREARKVLGDAFISDDGRYRLDRDRIAVDLDELAPLLRRAAPRRRRRAARRPRPAAHPS